MLRHLALLVSALLLACGGGGDASPAEDEHDDAVTFSEDELSEMEPVEACKAIQSKLISCRPTFQRVLGASLAGRTGPDDAIAMGWTQEPITAEMAGKICTEEDAGTFREHMTKCYSNSCRELVACLVGGSSGIELACPGGTYAIFNGRGDRNIGYCARPDGTPHGPMVVVRDEEIFIRGAFRDGKRHGTFHWETRGSSVTYEDGRVTAVNGAPPAQLASEPDADLNLLGAAVVGPPEVFGAKNVGDPASALRDATWEPCVEPRVEAKSFPDGQIRASFRVAKDGKVTDIEVDAFDAALATCWTERLAELELAEILEESEKVEAVDVRAVWTIRSMPPADDEDDG